MLLDFEFWQNRRKARRKSLPTSSTAFQRKSFIEQSEGLLRGMSPYRAMLRSSPHDQAVCTQEFVKNSPTPLLRTIYLETILRNLKRREGNNNSILGCRQNLYRTFISLFKIYFAWSATIQGLTTATEVNNPAPSLCFALSLIVVDPRISGEHPRVSVPGKPFRGAENNVFPMLCTKKKSNIHIPSHTINKKAGSKDRTISHSLCVIVR